MIANYWTWNRVRRSLDLSLSWTEALVTVVTEMSVLTTGHFSSKSSYKIYSSLQCLQLLEWGANHTAEVRETYCLHSVLRVGHNQAAPDLIGRGQPSRQFYWHPHRQKRGSDLQNAEVEIKRWLSLIVQWNLKSFFFLLRANFCLLLFFFFPICVLSETTFVCCKHSECLWGQV